MSLVHEIDYGTPVAKSAEQVTLTIDGQEVTVPAGTSIMRAAMDTGIQVPKLCATDSLDAFGSCRLCLVEIEGRAGTPASCTTPVAPNMVVHTQTDRLKRLRKGVMELYISDHPLDCLTCSANGDCELQDMAGAVGLLDAFGSCRLCLVEIEGRAGTPASCTTPVAPNMVVHTQTDRLKRLRKGVMELYISDHPLDCLTCSANGDCELQDMAGAVGLRD